jgi:hypothetical protein
MADAIALFLHQWQGRSYLARNVSGWYAHPLLSVDVQYYQLSKESH